MEGNKTEGNSQNKRTGRFSISKVSKNSRNSVYEDFDPLYEPPKRQFKVEIGDVHNNHAQKMPPRTISLDFLDEISKSEIPDIKINQPLTLNKQEFEREIAGVSGAKRFRVTRLSKPEPINLSELQFDIDVLENQTKKPDNPQSSPKTDSFGDNYSCVSRSGKFTISEETESSPTIKKRADSIDDLLGF